MIHSPVLREDVFSKIESDLFTGINHMMGCPHEPYCYDTTNFYTYIEEPKALELGTPCHSKASKHHLDTWDCHGGGEKPLACLC